MDKDFITIPLTRGMVTYVDAEDEPLVSKYRWCGYKGPRANTRYVLTNIRLANGLKTTIKLHRMLLGADKGVFVDHIDGDGLNNRRSNLRLCSRAENSRNISLRANNTSGYKGVSWNTLADKWHVYIKSDGRRMHLGYFDDVTEAALAYNCAATKYHGEFARLNDINWTD